MRRNGHGVGKISVKAFVSMSITPNDSGGSLLLI